MHAYPADLRAGGDTLSELLADYRVACVDMGHTHYNELANDGRTIFAATRSTGQIEEGPVGLSVVAVDGDVVSWRFQELNASWPLVLITSPADRRLITDPASGDQVIREHLRVAAKAWSGAGVRRAEGRLDDRAPFELTPSSTDASLWSAHRDAPALPDGPHRLTVRAEDAAGCTGEETITFLVSRAGVCDAPRRHADGSDRDAIGRWPEKGIPGGQLGPNRNGRKW